MHRSNSPSSYNRRPMGPTGDPARVFNAPGVVVGAIAATVIVFAALVFAPRGLAFQIGNWLGVRPPLFAAAAAGDIGWTAPVASTVGHMFVHGGLMHLGFNMLWLAAFGAPVARRLRIASNARGVANDAAPSLRAASSFLVFYLLCGAAGGLAFVAAHWGEATTLVGASGGVFGLLGAMTRFAFSRTAVLGAERARFSPLFDRSTLMWTLFVLATNNPFAVALLGALAGGANIAWEAHLGGFFFGMLTYPTFERALSRFRKRETPRLS